MAGPADIGGKRLIGLAPDAWARWVTRRPDVRVEAILSAEFQFVSRASDVLLRAVSPTLGHFLVLTELQLKPDPRMPRRTASYSMLGEEHFDLPVYPVVVNILLPARGGVIPDSYEHSFLGLTTRREFRVINLWEVEADLVLDQPLPALLPFVPVLRNGENEPAIRQALVQLRANEELSELEPLLAFFASYVLDVPLIRQMMRWDMVVLRQSPWYHEILEEGRQEGRQEGLREALSRLLEYRFGPLPDDVRARLARLTPEQLIDLEPVAMEVDSLAAFQDRLPA